MVFLTILKIFVLKVDETPSVKSAIPFASIFDFGCALESALLANMHSSLETHVVNDINHLGI